MLKKEANIVIAVLLSLLLLAILYTPSNTFDTDRLLQTNSLNTCNNDCCDSDNTECPTCQNSNTIDLYLCLGVSDYLPKPIFTSIMTDLETLSDQRVIKVIPHPPTFLL